MNRLIASSVMMLILICGIQVGGAADAKDKTTLYEVTITNITRRQIISPPIVISHNKDFRLFNLANPATPGMALLAEEGMPSVLETELGAMDSVFQYNSAAGGIPPGASVTVGIETQKGFRLLSAAGMLIFTNDAFFAVRGLKARSKGDATVPARAYDAGSERNSEDCTYIPGCGGGGAHDPAVAEGYVYPHSGIHGIGGLDPADYDWHNPVATIRVEKVK